MGMVVIAPFAYAYFMGYWTYGSMTIIEYIEPSTVSIASVLLILADTIGIVVVGILLYFPLNYMFGRNCSIAALVLAAFIVAWSIANWVMYAQGIPNYISIIEWLTVLVVMPSVVAVIYKRKSDVVVEDSA
jgi:hypothetical protein